MIRTDTLLLLRLWRIFLWLLLVQHITVNLHINDSFTNYILSNFVCCTSPVSVVWQCKLVSGWGLMKRRSAPLYGSCGSARTLHFYVVCCLMIVIYFMCRWHICSSHIILKWMKRAFHCWKDLMRGCIVGSLSTSCMVCIIFILIINVVCNISDNNTLKHRHTCRGCQCDLDCMFNITVFFRFVGWCDAHNGYAGLRRWINTDNFHVFGGMCLCLLISTGLI